MDIDDPHESEFRADFGLECDKCGAKDCSLTSSPLSLIIENKYEVCDNCYKLDLLDLSKRTCLICNPDTVNMNPMITGICTSCKQDGWKGQYDFSLGETICYKKVQ